MNDISEDLRHTLFKSNRINSDGNQIYVDVIETFKSGIPGWALEDRRGIKRGKAYIYMRASIIGPLDEEDIDDFARLIVEVERGVM